MPSTEADANKQALLDTLRAKKPLGTAASTNAKQEAHTNPPSRARDATGLLISRHFAGPSSAFHTNRPSGKVLVPNSSPIAPSTRPSSEYVPKMGHHGGSPGPSASTTSLVFRGKLMQQEIRSLGRKPALVPPSATASSSRSSSVRRRDDEDTSDSEARPRKRANNTSSSSPVDFDPLSSPIRGPGVGAVKSGVKEMQIDSSPLQPNGGSSPGKPRRRLVRGRRISSDDEESTPSPLISPKVENQEIKRTEAKPPIPPRTGPITVVRVTDVPVRIDKVKEQTVPFTRPTSLPTTTIKSHTKPTSPTKPQLKPKPKLVDIDSGSDLSSFDDDDESLDEADLQRIELALVYFNEASAEKLIEINACTQAQALAIISARPFEDEDQLRSKLNRKKGVSPRFFDDYVAMLRGYDSVDVIVERCELVAKQISDILAVWASASSDSPAEAPSTSTAMNSAPGTGIISLAPERLEFSANEVTDTQRTVRADALKNYIAVQPESLGDVKLKDYQLLGVNWLNLLHRRKLSCILADEMGLGKTAQVISFFAHLSEQCNKGPHLVIVPSSTLENWGREFAKFAPSLEVRTYYGMQNDRAYQRAELIADSGEWNVCITTYNIAQGNDVDRKFLKRIEWECCVFDEGHQLKNFESQRYQQLLKIPSKWRLLLTGTPLQNNLQELVSLMNFLLPDYFRDALDSLRAIFKVRQSSHTSLLSEDRVRRASKILTPFILRRRKDQVLQDLPNKTERIEWCQMTNLQQEIYNEALQRSRKMLEELPEDEKALLAVVDLDDADNEENAKKTKAKSKKKSTANSSAHVLMDLRKAACHPMLFRRRFNDKTLARMAKQCLAEPEFHDSEYAFVLEDMQVMTDAELQHFCKTYKSVRSNALANDVFLEAGKISRLLPLLDKYKSEGKRVLIFSQFTQVLDILQAIFKHRDIKYLILTGRTPVAERQGLVDTFTEDESIPVFLLSTKAGGMGINLTAACVVIIFDQDFNPHNDKQACDRAYRIGQKRDVEVVKLITRNTIEENMLQLGKVKLDLDDAVAAGEDESGGSEKAMKASLLSILRRQFSEQEKEALPADSPMQVDL